MAGIFFSDAVPTGQKLILGGQKCSDYSRKSAFMPQKASAAAEVAAAVAVVEMVATSTLPDHPLGVVLNVVAFMVG
ncbi:MAG: hypothetical protein JJ894_16380 [Dinoroseobacter sp.]|nr:hypothetical protein [Dinoroseobacter sp.]